MSFTKELQKYGNKHPIVSFAVAGTFSWYFYKSFVQEKLNKKEGKNWFSNPAGLGMTTSTSTTSSSSHIPELRENAGEPSMSIPAQMYGVSKLSGVPASARRRVGHSFGSSSLGYEAKVDPATFDRNVMNEIDAAKHEDILGSTGLLAPAGGDWYE